LRAYAEKPPPEMFQNLNALVDIEVSLTQCRQSSDYKKLKTDRALNMHDLSSRLRTMVQNMADFYHDDKLHGTFDMSWAMRMDSTDIRNQVKARFGSPCSPKMEYELTAFVAKAESNLSQYFKAHPRK